MWCSVLLVGLVLGCAATGGRIADDRPNIVIILIDDLGYHDLSIHGSNEVSTPNIDSIAREGVRLSHGYASAPICAPMRAGLLTGRYATRFGYGNRTGSALEQIERGRGVRTSEVFLSKHLKRLGYATGAIGKWHLGINRKYRPLNRGFDEFFGFLSGAHSFWTWSHWANGHNPIYRDNERIFGEEYLSFAFSNEAVNFIDRHKAEPFFLYLAYNAVHSPLHAPPEYL